MNSISDNTKKSTIVVGSIIMLTHVICDLLIHLKCIRDEGLDYGFNAIFTLSLTEILCIGLGLACFWISTKVFEDYVSEYSDTTVKAIILVWMVLSFATPLAMVEQKAFSIAKSSLLNDVFMKMLVSWFSCFVSFSFCIISVSVISSIISKVTGTAEVKRKARFKHEMEYESKNETELESIMNMYVREENYEEAERVKQILERKFRNS